MSGLARMLLDAGAIVTGSEPKPNAQTFDLARRGATISRDQLGELLSRDTDLVVRTAAVKDDNPEYLAARAYGLTPMKYAQLLGQVMAERFGIAVAGTHGKSTTTAMIAFALLECGADPSFVVGGTVGQLGGGSRSGASRFFVAEACEFDRSFHNLHPRVALITNVEEDHLDCYKDIHEIVASFADFARIVPPDGLIISNARDPRVAEALDGLLAPVELCAVVPPPSSREPPGREAPAVADAAWITRITGIERGCYRGQVTHHRQVVAELRLSIAGEHNLINATMALAACAACGLDAQQAAAALNRFTGVDRRMSEIGRCNGAIVVDDYGHHPTEIRATLTALRQRYQPRRLLCVFQPHQHSRTRFLLEDFAASFAMADETVVPDIYFVRDSEAERQRVSSADLVRRIIAHGARARHIADSPAIVAYLRSMVRAGDVVLTLGAGNVWEIGRDLVA